jgi:hypothetical protein
MIGDARLNAPWTDTGFEITYPAAAFQDTEVLQQASHRIESNDDNDEFDQRPRHLEAETWESLPFDVGQDLYITSATSSASAGFTNVCTAQQDAVSSSGNSNPSNQFVFTAEKVIECTVLDCDAPTSENKKVQE